MSQKLIYIIRKWFFFPTIKSVGKGSKSVRNVAFPTRGGTVENQDPEITHGGKYYEVINVDLMGWHGMRHGLVLLANLIVHVAWDLSKSLNTLCAMSRIRLTRLGHFLPLEMLTTGRKWGHLVGNMPETHVNTIFYHPFPTIILLFFTRNLLPTIWRR